MTTHPTPAPGDVWNYHWEQGECIRDYHVLVLSYSPEKNYRCLTLETGVIDSWLMDVEGDPQVWRFVV